MNTNDNKLIAEFMGVRTIGIDELRSILKQNREDGFIHDPQAYLVEELQYHTSWDWLMPVVDKIESMRDSDGNAYRFSIEMCNAEIENTNIQLLGEKYKIDAVYKVAVKFIKAVHTLKIKS